MSRAMDRCGTSSESDRVKIIGPETDLEFSIRGLPLSNRWNHEHSDGEVYTAPVRDSVNGILTTILQTKDGFIREYCFRIQRRQDRQARITILSG